MTVATVMREMLSDSELEKEIERTLQRLEAAQQPLNTHLAIMLPMQTHLQELLKMKRDRINEQLRKTPS